MLAKSLVVKVLAISFIGLAPAGCGESQSDASDPEPDRPKETTGPTRGSLVVAGGNLQDPAIVGHFVELAGGPDAAIVVVPTAAEVEPEEIDCPMLEPFTNAGVTELAVLHTRDPAEANTEEFVAPIRNADGVWFVGGRQWRIADSYLGTLSEREFHAVLQRRRCHRRVFCRGDDSGLIPRAR